MRLATLTQDNLAKATGGKALSELTMEQRASVKAKGYLPRSLPSKGRGYERDGPNALGFVTPALLDHHYDRSLGIDGLRRPQGSAEPPQHQR